MPHEDPLVVTLKVANCIVKRVLIDGGSTMKVMLYSKFQQIDLLDKEIIPITTPLVGSDGASMVPMGIKLEVTAGYRLLRVEFVIVNAISLYNIIMRRG